MDKEIPSEIRNKLTAPMIAFEKLTKGENVPKTFLERALNELKSITDLLQEDQPKRPYGRDINEY